MHPQRTAFDIAQLPPRYRSKIRIAESGCWHWVGAKTQAGYGQIKVAGRAVYCHRNVYEMLVGQIPSGLHIDHLCCNPSCVNPAHLEPVTCRVNILRGNGVSRINEEKTHCIAGHEFTPENTIRIQGGRRCRACENRRQREYYRAAHGLPLDTPRPQDKTHCRHGHAYDEVNTVIDNRGKRHCRTCVREQARRNYHARKKNGGK